MGSAARDLPESFRHLCQVGFRGFEGRELAVSAHYIHRAVGTYGGRDSNPVPRFKFPRLYAIFNGEEPLVTASRINETIRAEGNYGASRFKLPELVPIFDGIELLISGGHVDRAVRAQAGVRNYTASRFEIPLFFPVFDGIEPGVFTCHIYRAIRPRAG